MHTFAGLLLVAIICMFAQSTKALDFPNILKKCSYGDTKCIQEQTTLAVKNLYKGYQGLNLISIDPLDIPEIQLNQGAESPVNIKLKFTNVKLNGIHNNECTKIVGFGENPEGKYEIEFKGPQLSLIGPYTISGRVLLLPIQGTGDSNITIVEPNMRITFTGKSKTKKGKVYMQTDDLKYTFTTTRMWTHFDNLYNGDQVLGNTTNLFLNENWEDIFKELKGTIFEAFALIIQQVLNNIFGKVPYKELFKEG